MRKCPQKGLLLPKGIRLELAFVGFFLTVYVSEF